MYELLIDQKLYVIIRYCVPLDGWIFGETTAVLGTSNSLLISYAST